MTAIAILAGAFVALALYTTYLHIAVDARDKTIDELVEIIQMVANGEVKVVSIDSEDI